MTSKHLVLDYDVHLRLQKRKKETGLSLQTIGNFILREVLSRPGLGLSAVRERIIAAGIMEATDFDILVEQALKDVRHLAEIHHDLLEEEEDGSLTSGSWQMRETFRCPADSFQIIDARAINSLRRPMPAHIHDEDEFLHVLTGNVFLVDEGQQVMLGPSSCYRILTGHLHSTTPLDANVRAMITFVPAGQLFSERGEEGRVMSNG